MADKASPQGPSPPPVVRKPTRQRSSAPPPRPFNLIPTLDVKAHRSAVRALCTHGGRLASGGYDGAVCVWDVSRADRPVNALGGPETGKVYTLLDVPTHGLLASAGSDGLIRFWDVRIGESIMTLQGHTSAVTTLAARAQSNELFSGGGDEHVLIWDLRSGTGTSALRGQNTSTRDMVFAHGDNSILYTAGGDGQIRAWDCTRDFRASVQRYHAIELLRGPMFGVSSLVLTPGRPLLASAGLDNVIYCWDLTAHAALTGAGRVRAATHVLKGHLGVVNAVVSWGETILVSASADGTVRAWDSAAEDEEAALLRTFPIGEEYSVRSLLALEDTRLCTGSSDGHMHVWLRLDE